MRTAFRMVAYGGLPKGEFLGGKKSGGLPQYGKARNNNLKRQYSLTPVKAVLTFA